VSIPELLPEASLARPFTILFLEHGAPVRAPMAAGFLQHLARGRWAVRWAATADRAVAAGVERAMQEVDVAPGADRCPATGPFDLAIVLLDPLAGSAAGHEGAAAEEAACSGLRAALAARADPGLVPFLVHWHVPGLPAAAEAAPGEGPARPPDEEALAVLRASRDALRAQVVELVEHGYLAAMERHLGSAWETLDHSPVERARRAAEPCAARPGGGAADGDPPAERFHGLVARSTALRAVFRAVRQVALSDYPVLVTGESGTGKELVAAAIHAESRRAGGPFVPINCGALPEAILESELLGHVRGAFTGAIRDKKGRFELAHGGTLFLDEVGELTPAFQVKLLRVLQTKTFERVGGERSVTADVRIISATNRDLRALVRQGAFREDLFYRLCVVPIVLPPLRERPEDILPIAEDALRFIRAETDRPALALAEATRRALLAAPWPGNVRQLISALQYAAVHGPGAVIEPGHLPPEVRWPVSPDDAGANGGPPRRPSDERGRPRKLDVPAVEQALAETDGNKARAARALGVSRATLYRFLADEGLG
jgi:transcriptional regulator with GAF, ATPase, and Fis domain